MARTTYCLSEEEFYMCCTALDIRDMLCFAKDEERAYTDAGFAEALFALAERKLVIPGEDSLSLCPELQIAFAAIQQAKGVWLGYEKGENLPSQMLYRQADTYIALMRGTQARDYVRLTVYREADLGEWLENAGFGLCREIPEEMRAQLLLEKEETAEERGLDCLADLEGTAAEPICLLQEGHLPSGLEGALEYRSGADWAVEERLLFVRQPVFDRVVICRKDVCESDLYSTERVLEEIRTAGNRKRPGKLLEGAVLV